MIKKTEARFVFICFLAVLAIYTTPARSASIPSEILSPVVGDLEVVSSVEQCSNTKWCFNQHRSGGHVPGGGIGQADDTYAWDVNLNTPTFDSDEGKPVLAVAEGVVSQTYGGSINAGGSYGQLLIEHNFQGNTWWSGYLHLRDIQVTPGQSVDKDTLLGYISNISPDPIPNHLHFVVYKGENTRGGLISFDVNINARTVPILTLQEAASQGLIELESKGGYFGDKVTFISGPNPENVIIKIRKGDAILNKKHSGQNVVASKDLEIFIPASQIVRLGGIWVVCVDAHRSPPYSGDKFDVTYNIGIWDVSSAQMLFRLLEVIDEEELHEDWVAQDAVWKVTDNSPVGSTRAKDLLIRAGIDPDADILDFPHLLDPNSSSPETGMVVLPELPIVSPPDLESLIVYPNPFRSTKHTQVTFEGLTADVNIRIFTFSGELIYKAEITGQFNWKWNVKNTQGEKVARGIYFYLITDNNTGTKKTGKIAIIK